MKTYKITKVEDVYYTDSISDVVKAIEAHKDVRVQVVDVDYKDIPATPDAQEFFNSQ